MFTHPNWTQDIYSAGRICAINYLPNDEWNDILLEVESGIGDEIYQRVQQKTQQLKDSLNVTQLQRIPWITLNGHQSLRIQNDLLQTVCELWTGDKPLECIPVRVEIYYETLNAQSRTFFIDELRPTFERMRESFTLNLIPFGRTNMTINGPNDTTFDCPNGEQQCLGNKIQVSSHL